MDGLAQKKVMCVGLLWLLLVGVCLFIFGFVWVFFSLIRHYNPLS